MICLAFYYNRKVVQTFYSGLAMALKESYIYHTHGNGEMRTMTLEIKLYFSDTKHISDNIVVVISKLP